MKRMWSGFSVWTQWQRTEKTQRFKQTLTGIIVQCLTAGDEHVNKYNKYNSYHFTHFFTEVFRQFSVPLHGQTAPLHHVLLRYLSSSLHSPLHQHSLLSAVSAALIRYWLTAHCPPHTLHWQLGVCPSVWPAHHGTHTDSGPGRQDSGHTAVCLAHSDREQQRSVSITEEEFMIWSSSDLSVQSELIECTEWNLNSSLWTTVLLTHRASCGKLMNVLNKWWSDRTSAHYGVKNMLRIIMLTLIKCFMTKRCLLSDSCNDFCHIITTHYVPTWLFIYFSYVHMNKWQCPEIIMTQSSP